MSSELDILVLPFSFSCSIHFAAGRYPLVAEQAKFPLLLFDARTKVAILFPDLIPHTT